MKQYRGTGVVCLSVIAIFAVVGCGPTGNSGNPGSCPGPKEVSSNIASDTTWTAQGSKCVEYRVTNSVWVSEESTLTIEPGVTVVFASEASLGVYAKSALDAKGTSSKPVTFTGDQETPGFWGGIFFKNTQQSANRLEHVVVEHAGGYTPSFADVAANINVFVSGSSETSRVTIKQTTARNGAGYGMALDAGNDLPSFGNNTLTSNKLGAVRMPMSEVDHLDAESDYSGNDKDRVHVVGGAIDENATHTWANINTDYFLEGQYAVNGQLTISPGTTLRFDQGATFRIRSSGQLTAEGTSSKRITFTGNEETQGYWGGLAFVNSNSTANKLVHTTVAYGGSQVYSYANNQANVTVAVTGSSKNSRVSLQNATLSNSGGFGVSVDDNATVSCNGVTFEANSAGNIDNGDCS